MGDMKTPDFDDLLAAFDIPDMVDPKAAIESGHDDHESQLKPQGEGSILQEYEAHVPSTAPSVSVIVKNVRTMDASEHDAPADKEDHTHSVAMDSRLHSVLLSAVSSTDRYRKNKEKQSRDQGSCKLAASNLSSLNQFSPISSAEEFDDDDKIEVDDPMDKLAHRACLKREEQIPKPKLSDSTPKAVLNGGAETFQTDANNNPINNKDSVLSLAAHTRKPRRIDVKAPSAKLHQGQELNEAREPTAQGSLPPLSQAKGKSSYKLSSCIAAIAALSAKKASSTLDPAASNTPVTRREPVTPCRDSPKGAKESSPRAAEKPQEPESALEVAKRLLSKPPDSPSSVISEGSVKGSPDSPSTPVIPKVRIQTIKTSSGQIKRTVTRVLPGLDSEGAKTGDDAATATAASVTVPATLSSPTSTSSVFTSPAPPALPTTVVATSGGPTVEVSKPITIKPVATAFLPVSAVKTAGSQVINLKLANNTTVKATVIPAASVQSASSAILKAANAIQQQAIMVPASSLANAKVLPKAVHLTNLNLLPHAVTKASEIHQALAAKQPQRQGKQQATTGSQAPKKVSRVQVLASSQNSVVEAFNKVLSGINPVPVYVPDLSPPSAACIALPSRGYKCLECGDSFALERSLAQHYDRRSVRIEVTCNHCSKNLVFYNKCSLLSHARGHKDKGVVMQCSHLILKPIPADQMITTSPPPACSTMTSSSSTSSTLQAQASKSQSPGRGTSGGVPAAVISAPSSAPMVAAMPLEEDVTRLCRSSLKCLECSEVFQDESSLAMHYQKVQDSNGQKTCTICQMMLPNQCSFLSHQRIHQHKSPYICPECGASCRSVHFQSHVTRNCLHYTRRVGYRCVHCSVIYADIAALKSHIQGSHCEVFYKCPICPMAFKSAAGTHSHALTQHPGVKIGDPKLIYKCSMCDTVFTQQTLLYSHFDQHLVSQKVSVFKCPDCSMHYAQKQLMMDHIKAMHGTLKTIEGPPNLGINLPLSTKATNPMSASPNNKDAGGVNGLDKNPPASPLKKPNNKATSDPKKGADPGYTCSDCDRLFTSREVFVAHVRREHGKQLKKHPCRLCEKSFSSSHSLCRHNRLKHKGLRKVYTCPHCPGPSPQFTKRLLLDQHMQQKHGIKTTVDSAIAKASSDNDSSQTLSPKRKQEDHEGPPGPRSRDSDLAQPLKKQKVNVLKVHKCAVCSFTSEDVGAFREHIPQHKTDGSSFQCRECGFCFTSHPSLARHLFIVHRLKEPHGLNRRGGRGDGDDDESQRENQLGPAGVNADGTPDTQCKVCGKMFETEGSLNTHMRTHGMAFIKSKRLSSAEK